MFGIYGMLVKLKQKICKS